MKKTIFTILLSAVSLMAIAQYSDTTLTSLNWKFMEVGNKSALFTIPPDTMTSSSPDTGWIHFPVVFTSLMMARVSVDSDTLHDMLPEGDPFVGFLYVDTAPTSIGPWENAGQFQADTSPGNTYAYSFYVKDLFVRAYYLRQDGEGLIKSWITMKPVTSTP